MAFVYRDLLCAGEDYNASVLVNWFVDIERHRVYPRKSQLVLVSLSPIYQFIGNINTIELTLDRLKMKSNVLAKSSRTTHSPENAATRKNAAKSSFGTEID